MPASAPLDLIVQAGLAPDASLALDRALLAEVAARGRDGGGVLRVYDLAGTVLSLGRYHLLPPDVPAAVTLARRVAGGRAAPAGAGFMGVTLVMPDRAALVDDDPQALAPAQVINRCVRGLLEGLALLGVSAFYPGRETVTVGGRTIALAGFEVEPGGATLVEFVVCVARDLTALPPLLDAADPTGIVPAVMVTAAETTSLAGERGAAPSLEELAHAIRRGYETRMGLRFSPRDAPPATPDPAWLGQRRPRPDLDRHAVTRGQLGLVEVRCAVDGERLREAMISGDFLAASSGVAALEDALRGLPVDEPRIRAVVRAAFAPAERFFLGLEPLDLLADTILRAARA